MTRGNKSELIKCPYCGEMYSVTYKHCPFCNEDGTGRWDDPDPDVGRDRPGEVAGKGGKRLTGGGGPSLRSILGGVLSLALILTAAAIVVSVFRSILGEGRASYPLPASPAPLTAESAAPSAADSQVPAESAPPAEATPPAESLTPIPSDAPQPQVSAPSANGVTPTDFQLNRADFTFQQPGEVFDMRVKFTPADAAAEVQWKSSDPNIAAVSWNGRVTAVSRGTVTITATVPGVGERTCVCRCNFTASTSSGTASSVSAPSSGLKLNREDFTFGREGETFRMTVSGGSAVVWASSDTAVASVDANGTVKAVGKGVCNVTATVDGKTLKCVVRCVW